MYLIASLWIAGILYWFLVYWMPAKYTPGRFPHLGIECLDSVGEPG